MPSRLTSLVVFVAAAALALTSVVFYLFGVSTEAELSAVAFFTILAVVSQVLSYQLPRGASGSTSSIPILAGAVVAPGGAAVVGAAITLAVGELINHRSPLKFLFNTAQAAVATAIAVLTYRSLGGEALTSVQSFHWGALLAMVPAYVGVNTSLVSTAVALSTNRKWVDVWKKNTLGTIGYDILSAPAVFLFSYAYTRVGPVWACSLAIPLLGLRQLHKTNWALEQVNEELLQLMVAAIEARDPYTSGHSRRVAEYARVVCRAIGDSDRTTTRVVTAALLHDVGKIYEEFAPILRKPGRLNDDEYAVMKTHSEKGAALVSKVTSFGDLVPMVRGHHEAWDGTGYPDCIAGEAIPYGARVIAVADTIDAMTSRRPYREALELESVRRELLAQRGKQFAPNLIDALVQPSKWSMLAEALRATNAGVYTEEFTTPGDSTRKSVQTHAVSAQTE